MKPVRYHPYSLKLEEEMEMSILHDDIDVLKHRYLKTKREKTKTKLQSQWTRCADAVQEHFSSHVIINEGELEEPKEIQLPKEIYAMKRQAKESWVLYKKRECERRKRIRRKIEEEKENEESKKPANLLLALVDRCEFCKRFYITVNLFWGITLCDVCYFNEGVIREIMKKQKEKGSEKVHLMIAPPKPDHPPLVHYEPFPFRYIEKKQKPSENPFDDSEYKIQTQVENHFSPPLVDRKDILLEKKEEEELKPIPLPPSPSPILPECISPLPISPPSSPNFLFTEEDMEECHLNFDFRIEGSFYTHGSPIPFDE